MDVIEVTILQHTLVLPLYPNATVASISQDALQEFQRFNLKKAPQKVLFTKDSKGRVLSSTLPLPSAYLKDSNKIEIVVQDYSDQDLLSPIELDKLYRNWQNWEIRQIKEHVEQCIYREVPIIPDENLLNIVKEISTIQIESLQITCLSIYRLLLTKFPNAQLIMNAAEGISSIFVNSSIPNVLYYALDSFKDLSPLQLKLFECNKYMKSMLRSSIETHLSKFTTASEVQSNLFDKFASIMTLLNDEELLKVFDQFQRKRAQLATNENPVADEAEEKQSQIVEAENVKKIVNLNRLQSLILSEDSKIRIYSLEKLKKYLKQLQETSSSNALSIPNKRLSQQGEEQSTSSSGVHSVISPSKHATTAASPEDTASISNPLNSSMKDGAVLQIQTEKELIALLKTLFQALKNAIKARATTNNSTTANSGGKGPPVAPPSKEHGQFLKSLGSLSTAGRLITLAYNSSETDKASIVLILDCFVLLLTHLPEITPGELLQQQEQHHHLLNYEQTSLKKNILLGKRFTNIHRIFMIVGKDWYRLLFTLTHSYEYIALGNASIPLANQTIATSTVNSSSSSSSATTNTSTGIVDYELHDIAEKTAYLFSLIVIHGMPASWSSCTLQLENIVLVKYMIVNQINYRLYMSFTYILYLLKKCHHELLTVKNTSNASAQGKLKISSSMDSLASGNTAVVNNKEQQQILDQLQELCTMQHHVVLKQVWLWALQQEQSNFYIRRLACKIVSQITLMNTLNYFLWKLDPIPKLLEALTKCFHVRGQSQSIHFLFKESNSTLLGGGGLHLQSGLEDEFEEFDDDEDIDHHRSMNLGHEQDSSHASSDHQVLPDIRIDFIMIRLLLKTMLNLIQSSSSVNFFPQTHYGQLREYLESLHVGVSSNHDDFGSGSELSGDDYFLSSPEQSHPKSFSTMLLKDIAYEDRVIQMYFDMLMEILSV